MTKKIGRNEPCPCGSGHKFKMCCGNLVKSSSNNSQRIQRLLDELDKFFYRIANLKFLAKEYN